MLHAVLGTYQDDLIIMHPFTILFALFLIIPIAEIYLLLKVGGIIGAFPTVFLVVFTAVLGAFLLRVQGFSTLARVRETAARGGIPAIEMLEGAVLLVAGALLLTPGFFTDAIGFACLIPPLRRFVIVRLLQRFFQPFATSGGTHNDPHDNPHKPPRKPGIIEGEYRREDDS